MRQTKNSGNSYWSNILYKQQNNSEGEAPTVTTDDLNMGFSLNATVDGTVSSEGSSSVTDYGFVWSDHDNPTISDNIESVGSGPFTGSFDKAISSLPFSTLVYFAAYATNSTGTSYGTVLSGETNICLAAGTRITLANGDYKKIENVNYNDDLLVWNFDDKEFSHSKPIWMVKPFEASRYGSIKFSNGTELKTIADGRGHRIFNFDKGMFSFSMNEDTPIGTRTITNQEEIIQVTSKNIVKEKTVFYNIITHTHFNVFANDILTSTGLNNLYPIIDMKFVKKSQRKTEIQSEIPQKIIDGLRLTEQPINYPKIKEKIELMLSRQK